MNIIVWKGPFAVGVVMTSRKQQPPCWCTGERVELKTMVLCAVIGCSNRSDTGKGKRFFRLPTVVTHQGSQTEELSQKRQDLWLSRLKREDLRIDQYCHMRVCSDHFVLGSPCTLYDVNNPDWAPSIKL